MPGHVAPPARPAPRRARRTTGAPPRDPLAGQTQHRGQQGQGGEDHHEHDERHADATRGHERQAGEGQAEDGDDHGAAGEEDSLARRGQRPADRLGDGQAEGEVLAVPGHQEERVVDAGAEPDHRGHDRCPRGDVDAVGHERERARPDQEAEQPDDDGQACCDERAEGEEQDDEGGEDATGLVEVHRCLAERVVEVAARLEAEVGPVACLRDRRAQCRERRLVGLADHRVLQPDDGDPTVGGDHLGRDGALRVVGQHPGRVGRPELVRQPPELLLHGGEVALGPGGGEEGLALGARGRHDVRREATGAGVGAVQEGRGRRGVGARRLHGVVEGVPGGARQRCHRDGEDHPDPDGPPCVTGRPATPAVQDV